MKNPHTPRCSSSATFDALLWWAMLTVAVLAVPMLAVAVMLALPGGEMVQAATFVVTCWVSTWLGMWLVNTSKKAHPPRE